MKSNTPNRLNSWRWLLGCFLLFGLTTSYCRQSVDPPIPPEIPQLENFTSSHLGISGVAPTGWVETYPGTFKRFDDADDLTLIVQRSYPSIDAEWLLDATLLMAFSPLNDLPETGETVQTDFLLWTLYSTELVLESSLMVLDVAVAETETRSVIVAMLSQPDEADDMREGVFVPALEALVPTDDPHDDSIYEDNIDRFAYDDGLALDIQETEQSVTEGITEIQLTYASPGGGRVPATLMIPAGSGPFPGMVIQHGFPGHRFHMRNLGMRYARLGVAVVMIDAPWARPDRADRDYPLTFTSVDTEEQIQLIVDLCRAVDLLVARPDVDEDQLVYVGVSYGGAMGGLFAGVETRLKAYVLQVGDGGLVTHFFGIEDVVFALADWNEPNEHRAWFDTMWPVEPLNFVRRAAPAALLFLNGRTDPAVPAPDAFQYQEAASEPKTIIWYDAGHNLGEQALDDQIEWLGQFITLREAR